LIFYFNLLKLLNRFDGGIGKNMRKAAHPSGGIGKNMRKAAPPSASGGIDSSKPCHWRAWQLHHHVDSVW
jgi:hypothetical protein